MSYHGSGGLIHHHHHDYGYHHLVPAIRSPIVSTVPDSSFVAGVDHHQRLDCSMSAVASALTSYPHQQTIGASESVQIHHAEHSQSIAQPNSLKTKSSVSR